MIAVAIDGPAGAGKSTIAKKAAEELGFIYVDTGAIYRAAALACIESHTAIDDAAAVEALLPQLDIRIIFFNGEQHILLNDKDVSESIRSENVSMAASRVSAIPAVRKFLLDLQRNFAKNADVIMDGRDIGTVVLPNAQVKIFLTASPEVRAKRRVLQLEEKGEKADFDKILYDIVQRDYNDTNRKTAPLKAAETAVMVDTSEMTLEEVVNRIVAIIKEQGI
ncbi:MAG TPA: (d)CMP kinase [Ruminococcaceae bacterium]|nr:(d)CMP kinase [Oscillospiraceae bacterium]